MLEKLHGSRWPPSFMWTSDVWSELLEKENSARGVKTIIQQEQKLQPLDSVWYSMSRPEGRRTTWLTVKWRLQQTGHLRCGGSGHREVTVYRKLGTLRPQNREIDGLNWRAGSPCQHNGAGDWESEHSMELDNKQGWGVAEYMQSGLCNHIIENISLF